MCIAIIKERNIELPSDDILKNCWNNNPDGAGFAFAFNDKVIIKKGYMTFKSFIKALHKYNNKYNLKDCGMLLHFRIATHGAVDQSMTHPFPIIDDDGCLKKTEFVSDYAVIHNGIISLTSYEASKNKGLSDTALFIKDYLTKIAQNKDWTKNQSNIELIEKLIDSKMAILEKNGDIIHTTGFTEDNGILYSNSSYLDSYQRYFKTKNIKSTYSYLNDTYDYDYGYGYNDDYCNGYYGTCSYEDYISEKVDEKGIIIELMSLRQGLIIDEPWYIEVNEDDLFYIDNGLNLYVKNEYEDDRIEYEFWGTCTVYDENIKEIEFKANTKAYLGQISYM